MMPRTPPVSIEAALPQAIHDELHKRTSALADLLGPLPNSVLPSKPEADARWDYRTDQVPPEMTPQLAREALKKIADEHQASGQPLPPQDQLTLLVASSVNKVLYPHRRLLVTSETPIPQDQIKVAESYARSSQKRQPEPMAVSAPTAVPAPAAALQATAPAAVAPLQNTMPAAVQALAAQGSVRP